MQNKSQSEDQLVAGFGFYGWKEQTGMSHGEWVDDIEDWFKARLQRLIILMTTVNAYKPWDIHRKFLKEISSHILRNCTFSRVHNYISTVSILLDVLQQTVRKISRASCRHHGQTGSYHISYMTITK